MNKYDYIIAGSGASGLSLLYYLSEYENQKNKKILLIDNKIKNTNDRTWCFWQKGDSPFESCITKTWTKLDFFSPDFLDTLDISPYKYKMIESKNFYDFCFNKIKKDLNIEIITDEIIEINKNGILKTQNNEYKADYIFNSAIRNIPEENHKFYLYQHFKGYFIQTDKNIFDDNKATLMDFRITQHKQCRFVYVLPFNKNEALVEFTIFSEDLLDDDEYDNEIKKYINDYLLITDYKVTRTEFGIIPMTNANIEFKQSDKVINIGTAGGFTKASTGYTFSFIQKQCRAIAQNIALKSTVTNNEKNRKYDIFDTIFLSVLSNKEYESRKIFSDLFKNLKSETIFKFLDEETSFIEDFSIINSVEKTQFIKSAINEAFKII